MLQFFNELKSAPGELSHRPGVSDSAAIVHFPRAAVLIITGEARQGKFDENRRILLQRFSCIYDDSYAAFGHINSAAFGDKAPPPVGYHHRVCGGDSRASTTFFFVSGHFVSVMPSAKDRG